MERPGSPDPVRAIGVLSLFPLWSPKGCDPARHLYSLRYSPATNSIGVSSVSTPSSLRRSDSLVR